MNDENKPVHEVRLGVVKAAIWANETDSGLRHNVTFQRIFLEHDEWKTTDSFGRDELPLVAKVAGEAHTWIYRDGGDRDGNGNGSDAANRPLPLLTEA